MKRLVIYFHYDPAGRIDTACRIAVQAMQKYAKVLFVTNGTLTPADRVWVQAVGRCQQARRLFRPVSRRRVATGYAGRRRSPATTAAPG